MDGNLSKNSCKPVGGMYFLTNKKNMGLFGFGSSKPKKKIKKNCWHVQCGNCGTQFYALRYKGDWPGKRGPGNPCPCCGARDELSFTDRYWVCDCGDAHFANYGDDYYCKKCGVSPDRTFEVSPLDRRNF